MVMYDRTFDKWALIEEEVGMILKSKGLPLTLEELDGLGFDNIDTMTVSLDSVQFKALSSQIAAFDTNNKLGFFRGNNKTATFETAEVEFSSGYKTMLKGFRPLVDGGTVTAEVGRRSRQSDTVTYTSSLSQSAAGRFTTRVNDNFHRIRLTVSGSWTDAIGIDVPKEDLVRTGRRG